MLYEKIEKRNGDIIDVSFVPIGNSDTTKTTTINCPLCNTPMLYKHLTNKLINESQTDLWVCPACPSVLLKYYNENDIKNAGKELKKLKPLIF